LQTLHWDSPSPHQPRAADAMLTITSHDAGEHADSARVNPRQGQRHDTRGDPACPSSGSRRQSVASIETVGSARSECQQRGGQYEAKARQQAHRGVAEDELLLDRLDQDIEDGAIEKIQGIDAGPRGQDGRGAGRRPPQARELFWGYPGIGDKAGRAKSDAAIRPRACCDRPRSVRSGSSAAANGRRRR